MGAAAVRCAGSSFRIADRTRAWIDQDAIRLLDLSEALFGELISWIKIRVVLAGEFPVGSTDFAG